MIVVDLLLAVRNSLLVGLYCIVGRPKICWVLRNDVPPGQRGLRPRAEPLWTGERGSEALEGCGTSVTDLLQGPRERRGKGQKPGLADRPQAKAMLRRGRGRKSPSSGPLVRGRRAAKSDPLASSALMAWSAHMIGWKTHKQTMKKEENHPPTLGAHLSPSGPQCADDEASQAPTCLA